MGLGGGDGHPGHVSRQLACALPSTALHAHARLQQRGLWLNRRRVQGHRALALALSGMSHAACNSMQWSSTPHALHALAPPTPAT